MGATAGASAGEMIAEAIKASGAIVRMSPEDFLAILVRMEHPLVVVAQGGFLSAKYQYLTSYKGLAFFAKSDKPLELPGAAEVVRAKKIWIPG